MGAKAAASFHVHARNTGDRGVTALAGWEREGSSVSTHVVLCVGASCPAPQDVHDAARGRWARTY